MRSAFAVCSLVRGRLRSVHLLTGVTLLFAVVHLFPLWFAVVHLFPLWFDVVHLFPLWFAVVREFGIQIVLVLRSYFFCSSCFAMWAKVGP